jgi:subtilisin family serine protease
LGRVLTDGLWFALLDPDVDESDLRALGVSWLGGHYPEDKITPQVAAEGWGAWALEGDGRVALQARFFEDASVGVLRGILADLGAEVRRVDLRLQKVELAIAVEQARELLELDAIRWVEEAPPPRMPFNDASRQLVGADVLQAAPYGLTGSGVVLGICDGGTVGSHPDFSGRLELLVASAPTDHATHVAGTMAGSGAQSMTAGGMSLQWRGVAPGADIVSWRFSDPVSPHADLVQRGGVLSQNSWGLLISTQTFSCHLHGAYQYFAPEYDEIVRGFYDDTPVCVVFAAGNFRRGSNTNECGYGPYGVVAPPGTAKNVITVGAVDSVTDAMAFFSSWGPVADGRLKPDVVAPGWQASGDEGVTSSSTNGIGLYRVFDRGPSEPVSGGRSAALDDEGGSDSHGEGFGREQ